MRYLGIDFGAKRIGLALSDERGKLAFPHAVIENDTHALPKISRLCAAEPVGQIVIGHSLTYDRGDNPIHHEAINFAGRLAAAVNLPLAWQDETLSTQAARRVPSGAREAKNEETDARAAALILQTYLDRL